MTGAVLSLYAKEEESAPKTTVGRCTFVEGNAVRQVSILSEETVLKLRGGAGQGLCTRKFVPNIVVSGMRVHELEIGSELYIGNTEMKITETGKACFPECGLYQAGTSCALAKESVFARVLRGGVVKTGDAVRYIGG